MKRWVAVTLTIFVVLIMAGVGAFLYGTRAVVGHEYAPPVTLEKRAQNTAILSVLNASGITKALVDATNERVYVAYEVPNGTDPAKYDELQERALGAAAGGAGTAPLAIIVQYVHGNATLMWKADLVKFADVKSGKMTPATYLESVQKTTL